MYYRSSMGAVPAEMQPVDPYAGGPPGLTPPKVAPKGAWDWLKQLGSRTLGIYGAGRAAAGREAAYREELERRRQAAGTPAWLLPVGVVGAAVLLALLLRKKKAA